MQFIIAAALAASVSWLGNRIALKRLGTKVIVVSAPLLEELAKSSLAILTGASILLTHGAFGLIEAVYDAWGSGTEGLKAGVASFTGHLLFGGITEWVHNKSGLLVIAILSGYLAHVIWNLVVMRFIVVIRRIKR